MTTYLGIDQSLNGTGLCHLNADGTVLSLETVDPGKRRGAERLAFVKARVKELLLQEVKLAVFEGYSYGSISQHFHLGEMGGVLRLAAYEAGVPYLEIAPLSLKKFATGDAQAKKDGMVRMARYEGTHPQDDNQADAFFLALIAFHIDTGKTPRGRARIEVIHQIKNPKVKTTRRARTFVKHAI